MSDTHTCAKCGDAFTVAAAIRNRYPNWIPKHCSKCHKSAPRGGAARSTKAPRRVSKTSRSRVELNLTTREVLERFHEGPNTGVFTDGSCDPNPGPGGWGVVYVVGGDIIDQRHGTASDTTNNRMELTALLEAYRLVPPNTATELFTDSQLCVNIVTQWAEGWARRGWRRKDGPIKNLDLVQPLYEAARARPEIALRWIKAHDGSRWNEYADSLSTAYLRDEV